MKTPSLRKARELSQNFTLPLHPAYVYPWNLLTHEESTQLLEYFSSVTFKNSCITIPADQQFSYILAILGIEHTLTSSTLSLSRSSTLALFANFDVEAFEDFVEKITELTTHTPQEHIFTLLQSTNSYTLPDITSTYIGCRLGRPPKARERKSQRYGFYSPRNYFFPSHCVIQPLNIPLVLKPTLSYLRDQLYASDQLSPFIDYKHIQTYDDAYNTCLHARHHVTIYKDGTARFDATQIGLTQFTPKEIGTSLESLHTLGYHHDIHGAPLEKEDQLLHLQPQDIILPTSSISFLTKTATMINDLCNHIYNCPSLFSNSLTQQDFIGELIVGLAPHTASGIVGRIIGFCDIQGCLAHPLWHAAQRRNLDGDETSILLFYDVLLNFTSRHLPTTRGAQSMDVPLTYTPTIIAQELDNEIYFFDISKNYSLETLQKMKQGELLTIDDYDALSPSTYPLCSEYTAHTTHNALTLAPPSSSLPQSNSIQETVLHQLSLNQHLESTPVQKTIELLVEKHLLRHIFKNYKHFLQGKLRCVQCNHIALRPSLKNTCLKCAHNVLSPIAFPNSFLTYLDLIHTIMQQYPFTYSFSTQVNFLEAKSAQFRENKDI